MQIYDKMRFLQDKGTNVQGVRKVMGKSAYLQRMPVELLKIVYIYKKLYDRCKIVRGIIKALNCAGSTRFFPSLFYSLAYCEIQTVVASEKTASVTVGKQDIFRVACTVPAKSFIVRHTHHKTPPKKGGCNRQSFKERTGLLLNISTAFQICDLRGFFIYMSIS